MVIFLENTSLEPKIGFFERRISLRSKVHNKFGGQKKLPVLAFPQKVFLFSAMYEI